MQGTASETCCPPFDPAPWDGRELVWENRRFVKDRVRSLFHIPLNFGAVMRRNMARIDAAGARAPVQLVLSDERSPWGADVYIEVSGAVPGAETATISGTLLSRVFEGPYRNMRQWMDQMRAFVRGRGKTIGQLYVFYTTCPKCAKKYGKNYVVMLARV